MVTVCSGLHGPACSDPASPALGELRRWRGVPGSGGRRPASPSRFGRCRLLEQQVGSPLGHLADRVAHRCQRRVGELGHAEVVVADPAAAFQSSHRPSSSGSDRSTKAPDSARIAGIASPSIAPRCRRGPSPPPAWCRGCPCRRPGADVLLLDDHVVLHRVVLLDQVLAADDLVEGGDRELDLAAGGRAVIRVAATGCCHKSEDECHEGNRGESRSPVPSALHQRVGHQPYCGSASTRAAAQTYTRPRRPARTTGHMSRHAGCGRDYMVSRRPCEPGQPSWHGRGRRARPCGCARTAGSPRRTRPRDRTPGTAPTTVASAG